MRLGRATPGNTCLLGNVGMPDVLTFGKRDAVIEECRWRTEKVKPESDCILSSGCAISPNAPAENLRVLVESARRGGQY